MKIQSFKHNCGGAMLMTAILAVFVAGALVIYLQLTTTEYKMTARSQTWNDSMAVAEAGMEEGLALINSGIGQYANVTNWYASLATPNWDTSASYTTNI